MQLATTVNKPMSKLQVKGFLFEMGGIEVIGSRDKKGFASLIIFWKTSVIQAISTCIKTLTCKEVTKIFNQSKI